MKTLRLFLLLSLIAPASLAAARPADEPALVVVVVFDQFPQEYLVRFRPYFKDGLARLLDNGAVFTEATYKHAQCTTGPGHAAIMSGTYGVDNGITMNTWYDRQRKKKIYCVQDDSVAIIGAKGDGRSPAWYAASSLGDMLRLHTGFRSKVISLSNKDRAAILMGGRMPDGAYWMMDSVFVTSSYYRKDLPAWLHDFNRSGRINSYFGKSWVQSLPEKAFASMDRDDAPYEADHDGLGRAFPHIVTGTSRTELTPSYYSALMTTPFGAEVLADVARRAVVGEKLGKRGVTDLLCISFSSTDYVGHAYGPQSREVLEMAVAMDRILGRFLAFLDTEVGLRHCVVALSSDHGISPIPEYILAHSPHASAGRVSGDMVLTRAEEILRHTLGAPPSGPWIEAVSDHNIYLNMSALGERHIDPARAAAALVDSSRSIPGIARAINMLDPGSESGTELAARAKRSYRPDRSGEVLYMLKPYHLEGEAQGTGHLDPYSYNAHVPLILMGPRFRPGSYYADAAPVDIAPTLAAMLGVEMPVLFSGRVLSEAFVR